MPYVRDLCRLFVIADAIVRETAEIVVRYPPRVLVRMRLDLSHLFVDFVCPFCGLGAIYYSCRGKLGSENTKLQDIGVYSKLDLSKSREPAILAERCRNYLTPSNKVGENATSTNPRRHFQGGVVRMGLEMEGVRGGRAGRPPSTTPGPRYLQREREGWRSFSTS